MRTRLVILILLVMSHTGRAQNNATTPAAAIAPRPDYYLSTDFVYDVESIPTIGYETFFTKKEKLRSWRFDLSYQIHYSDQFGIVFSHGDRISVGVYQGPALKAGRNIYYKQKRNRLNYFTYGLAVKYLWYNNERVNTGRRIDPAYRIQSEHCIDGVPQIAIGTKRSNKSFCADFYAGLQFPVKRRYRTVYQEENSHGTVNLDVPYNLNATTFAPAPLVGIRLGYTGRKEKG